MKLFKQHPLNDKYFADLHLYVDDLRELQNQRDKAYNTGYKGEGEFYDRLIEGAQRTLEYVQEKVLETGERHANTK